MKKRISAILIVAVVALGTLLVQSAYAEKGACKYGKGKKQGYEEKIMKKMHKMMMHKDELGLSDEQVAKIKDLKVATKKDMIMKKAQIEVLAIDIKAAMYEDELDVEGVNKLIDQKYNLKKEKAKALVQTCSKLRGILSKEQRDKMKEMMKEKKKPEMGAGMRQHMMGRMKHHE